MEELELNSVSQSSSDLLQDLIHLLDRIKPWSEDLYESEYYFDKRWLEVQSDKKAIIQHIFRANGEYLKSTNGNILTGKWEILENSNTMILERQVGSGIIEKQLFDLSFLNDDFFILKKNSAQQQFLILGRNQLVKSLDLEQVIDLIDSRFRNSQSLAKIVFFVLAIVAIFLLYHYST